MNARLSRHTLAQLPVAVRSPGRALADLRVGMVHVGVGAFHRAHQAVYTQDAIAAGGGDWGILGVSLRHADTVDALTAQDCLYTVETLAEPNSYRVIGAVRAGIAASAHGARLLSALASPAVHVVTLTITEKGYCLNSAGELNFTDPDITDDLQSGAQPKTALGWLVRGLALRLAAGGAPLTIISCDNLAANGPKLQQAVTAFAERCQPQILGWLRTSVSFPQTVVDCLVPATTAAVRARVQTALGLEDLACVQREAYSQWVIEDRFSGPRPAWERAGVDITVDVTGYAQLKLHVLNACHSALAYLGVPRGFAFVHEAIADAELAEFLEELVHTEVAPTLAPLRVMDYWPRVRERFRNPKLEHRLAQIAEDGSVKLAQRIFPLLIRNARSNTPTCRLARVVRWWLRLAADGTVKDPQSGRLQQWAGRDLDPLLADPLLFPAEIRGNAAVLASLRAAAV